MRSLLHNPRARKRSIAVATLGMLALLGSLLVAAPAQALSDTGTGGVFVPATGRILDTKNNIGGYNTAMPAKTWRTVGVAGKAGVPNDGSVGAVSVVATVADIATQGQLFGRPDASEPSTMMGIYGGEDSQNTSFSAVLAVNADGTIQVQTETAARLILDVQGYYTANTDGTAPGGFVPLNGKRIVDTRSGLGAPKATLASGDRIDVQVTGTADVPAGASAVIVNMIAVNTTDRVGYLTPYAAGVSRPTNSFNYAGSTATSMQAQVQLSSTGKISVYNNNSTTNLVVEVQGYFTAAGKGGANFTPGAGRAYDTRTGTRTALARNEIRSIQIAGVTGVPVMGSGVNAVVLTLTALKSTTGGGYATVWADGTPKPATTAINFDETTIRTNTITVPLGANGKISLQNLADPTDYVIDVQGWYADPDAAKIVCDAPAANQTVLPVVPANAITCTVSASPSHATGEALAVSIDFGTDAHTMRLSDSERTSQLFSVSNEPGQHSITVDRVSTDRVITSDYTFTIGDWRQNTYDSSQELVRDTSLTPALFIAATDAPFPDDAHYRYSVYTDYDGTIGTTPVVVSDWTDDAWVVPAGALQDGLKYFWSAEVRGSYNYSGDQATIITPRFGLAPLASMEDEVTPVPASDADTEIRSGEVCDPGVQFVCPMDTGYTGWGPATTKVVKKSVLEKAHRGGKVGVGCRAEGSQPCSTDTSVSATVAIGLSLGMSRKAVAASLNITASATVTLSVRCAAGPHRQVEAYASGPLYRYKIHSIRYYIGGGRVTNQKDEKTSGWKTAFRPNKVACVESKL